MKNFLIFMTVFSIQKLHAQIPVSLKEFSTKNGAKVQVSKNNLSVSWQTENNKRGEVVINLERNQPLIHELNVLNGNITTSIVKNVNPIFVLTVGKRDLISQNGWNIFFDRVPKKPFKAHLVKLDKNSVSVRSAGTRTIIEVSEITAPDFKGTIEFTLYNGSPLINIAAVMSTQKDSTAIIYDAGIVSNALKWDNIAWSDVDNSLQTIKPNLNDSSKNEAVKYRTIIGKTNSGSLAIFPAPHQYFYPLDEAFNLKFTWHGNHFRNMVEGYGIGIRQDLYGDNRYVPWFNAPPNTLQRMNFFCLLSEKSPADALEAVKKFTNNDKYLALPHFKTLASHFHNEFITKVVAKGLPIPEVPSFISVFKNTGIDMVHLAEFHGAGHPDDAGEIRLKELDLLFQQCKRLSKDGFLLMPGEEPNHFFGGHWLEIFPKPIYWIMSRKDDEPFVSQHPIYGTIYRIKDSAEMLNLLQQENGLAWTAHPRTKGSTGFPDKYKDAPFFKSAHFLGAAWKAMPADLSQPRLGKRVLDLMDDMNNWGNHKTVLAESDIFTIEPENEMYAHLNVNYMMMENVPTYEKGWQEVVDVMQKGKFFSTTGEVLIPTFTINNQKTGETVELAKNAKANVSFSLQWTFPLNFAEIISGDGIKVYREKINLDSTLPFGKKTIQIPLDLSKRKWVRLEVWDIAGSGAFTQTVWLK